MLPLKQFCPIALNMPPFMMCQILNECKCFLLVDSIRKREVKDKDWARAAPYSLYE